MQLKGKEVIRKQHTTKKACSRQINNIHRHEATLIFKILLLHCVLHVSAADILRRMPLKLFGSPEELFIYYYLLYGLCTR